MKFLCLWIIRIRSKLAIVD